MHRMHPGNRTGLGAQHARIHLLVNRSGNVSTLCGLPRDLGAVHRAAPDFHHQYASPCSWVPRRQLTVLAPVPKCSAIPPAVSPTASRLQAVLDRIDQLNSKDPRSVEVDGQSLPFELAYSRWLTDWVLKLASDDTTPATEELMIVARGQHVQRWLVPRKSYPEGRVAYLKWREDLKKLHAKTVTDIMRDVGYAEDACSKVESMILKKNLKEADNQTVEDALCLVFLQYQFTEFRMKETEEKLVDIVRKTWKKMGEKGRAAALALAPSMPPENRAIVQKALS